MGDGRREDCGGCDDRDNELGRRIRQAIPANPGTSLPTLAILYQPMLPSDQGLSAFLTGDLSPVDAVVRPLPARRL